MWWRKKEEPINANALPPLIIGKHFFAEWQVSFKRWNIYRTSMVAEGSNIDDRGLSFNAYNAKNATDLIAALDATVQGEGRR